MKWKANRPAVLKSWHVESTCYSVSHFLWVLCYVFFISRFNHKVTALESNAWLTQNKFIVVYMFSWFMGGCTDWWMDGWNHALRDELENCWMLEWIYMCVHVCIFCCVLTGVIVTARRFDRERQREYSITVTATDWAEEPLIGICQLTVQILDQNDNSPKFENSRYECKW